MSKLSYPNEWSYLSQDLSNRHYLLEFARDFSGSTVELADAFDAMDFFFNVYNLSEKSASDMVGLIIFPDEKDSFQEFLDEFAKFLVEKQELRGISDRDLELPLNLRKAASQFNEGLLKHGAAKWVG